MGSWRTTGRLQRITLNPKHMISLLTRRLKRESIDTFVSGLDSNNVSSAVENLKQLGPSALAQ